MKTKFIDNDVGPEPRWPRLGNIHGRLVIQRHPGGLWWDLATGRLVEKNEEDDVELLMPGQVVQLTQE